MTPAPAVVVDVLLILGMAVEAMCCLGVIVGRGPLDRLHYAGAASTVGPVLFAAAILAADGLSTAGVLTILTVAFVVVSGPVLVVATARITQVHESSATGDDVEVAG